MELLRKILTSLTICALTFKVCDVAFGYFVGERQLLIYGNQGRSLALRELSPNQHVKIRPMPTELKHALTLVDKEYLVRTDFNGFIMTGNEVIHEPTHRILFLGGSTTESRFVDEKQRFPSLVEQGLRDYGIDVNVFNGGVAGSHSLHSNLNLMGKSLPLNLAIAVWMHNVNDLGLLSKTNSYWQAPATKAVIIESEQQYENLSVFHVALAVKDFFIPNLYGYLKPRLWPSLKFSRPDEYQEFRSEKSLSKINFRQVEQQFLQSILTFINICRAWNIEPILMTQFNQIESKSGIFEQEYSEFHGMDIEVYVHLYQSFNEIIRLAARENEVAIIDLANEIPADSHYMYDSVHLTSGGSERVSEVITPILIDILGSGAMRSYKKTKNVVREKKILPRE